ncbi:hypothetical protein [Streptomyces phaeochromogenes]|uniref:hypothetical protein n=1 Tax=Streptomyces phaeochromogenes TaxID=1923 RepID=UPI00372487A8
MPSPSPHATVLHAGRRTVLGLLIAAVIPLLLGVAGVGGLVTGRVTMEILIMVGVGVLGVMMLVVAWRQRHQKIAADHTGLWVHNGRAAQVIHWESVAGIGVYYTAQAVSLEVVPRGLADDRDPVLRALIRDDEPLAPELPRVRYRVSLPQVGWRTLAEAVRRHSEPHPSLLWCGQINYNPVMAAPARRRSHRT